MADEKQGNYEYMVTSGLQPLVIAIDRDTHQTHVVRGKELEEYNKRSQQNQETQQAEIAPKAPNTDSKQQTPQQAQQAPQPIGVGNAYAEMNIGTTSQPQATTTQSNKETNKEEDWLKQLQDAKTLEEALAKIIMQMLDEMMKSYAGKEFGNIGNQLSESSQKLDNALAARNKETPSREVDRTPLTERQQQNYDKWMKQANISPEDQAQLQAKYGPKEAYNIVQKCMAEPKKVNDAMGEGFKNSKQSIEYMANLDINKPENQAKADKVISIDQPKLNMTMFKQHQGR